MLTAMEEKKIREINYNIEKNKTKEEKEEQKMKERAKALVNLADKINATTEIGKTQPYYRAETEEFIFLFDINTLQIRSKKNENEKITLSPIAPLNIWVIYDNFKIGGSNVGNDKKFF